MKNPKPTTCYFDPDEARAIGEIADKEERRKSKIVQFAVRAFANLYKTDPSKAMQLARAGR